MEKRQLKLSLLKDVYGICKLPGDSPIPDWTQKGSWYSITQTEKELTIVCPQGVIPARVEYDGNWRGFRIDGSFDFSQIGVISSIAGPLAKAHISIYVISTYDTDYFLVKEANVEQAVTVLTDEGHSIEGKGNFTSYFGA